MLSLFSNLGAAIKFAKYAALIPLVMNLVKSAEQAGRAGSGKEKREGVVNAGKLLVEAFVKKGFLPPELGEMIEKDLGALTDVVVEVFNAVGIFQRSEPAAASATGRN